MSIKATVIALATAASALAGAALAIAEELEGGSPAPAEVGGEPTGDTAEKKGRGRPAGSTNKPKETTTAEPEKEEKSEPEKNKVGKTYEELQKIIEPAVKDGKSEEIRVLIKKHGGDKLSMIPPGNHAAFEKDVDALTL